MVAVDSQPPSADRAPGPSVNLDELFATFAIQGGDGSGERRSKQKPGSNRQSVHR